MGSRVRHKIDQCPGHAPDGADVAAADVSASRNSPTFWRSLEERAGDPAFEEYLHREFPDAASIWPEGVSRRRFLQLMGASLALAGLNACTRAPNEEIVPYVKAPEEVVPGKALFFATALALAGGARGVLVESHTGRPTKIEGNPEHPASLGATDVFAQAAILTLYDPDRSTTVLQFNAPSSWRSFVTALEAERAKWQASRGAGLRILTGDVVSPTLHEQIRALLAALPEARWHRYEAVNDDNEWQGAQMALGRPVGTVYRLETADVIVALDSDLLSEPAAGVRYSREFGQRRKARAGGDGQPVDMNRLYVAEPMPTPTGAAADHRLALQAGQVRSLVLALARQLGVAVENTGEVDASVERQHGRWIEAVAADLKEHAGRSVVTAGRGQPAEVHAVVHAINAALGNVGQTVVYVEPVDVGPRGGMAGLAQLVQDIDQGAVDTLVVMGVNPVYDGPGDLDFLKRLERVRLRIHHGLYVDETARQCHWHVPGTHELEMWSDARAWDGTASIVQPLIRPLYQGKSGHELISALAGEPERSGYELVRGYWQKRLPAGQAFDLWWEKTVHDGVVAQSASAAVNVAARGVVRLSGASVGGAAGDGLEIVFQPDPSLWDGRWSNNAWLQELPRPVTKLTWDNAALMSPVTAQKLGVGSQDLVELEYRGRKVSAPVWLTPGVAVGSVVVYLGYGRTHAGKVGSGAGFNAYAIRPSDSPWYGQGLRVMKAGGTYKLASAQMHHSMEGRNLVRTMPIAQFLREARGGHGSHGGEGGHDQASKAHHLPILSLYPEYDYSNNHAWGMVIDLSSCTGCNACVIACQAENNIPTVGKEQVAKGREMHWIRVDQYFEGSAEAPELHQQPVTCMHCEKAPCEVVCPVGATTHSVEGLNEMTYNRCIGTRYCSNNCPYKVRRFNFLPFADRQTPVRQLGYNPNVTVRAHGVMEKCTYCVQRISAARIEAKKGDRPIRDGEVTPACAAACPSQAIVFGDLNDKKSRVAQEHGQPHNYGLLEDLGVQPRTTYLARVRNLNPRLG